MPGGAIAGRGCLEVEELLAIVEPACDEGLRRAALAHASTCESCRLAIAGVARALDSATTDPEDGHGTARAMPTRIDRYAVRREVGRGSMGVVYEADDPLLHRRVAIKRMRPGVAAPEPSRLRREARALARLAHPNVVGVLEAGADWFAMEFVDGEPLATWQRGRAWPEIVAAYLDAARGLAAAHALGIVHRDFKPHNALVDRGDDGRPRVRVVDFGLASAYGPSAGAPDETTLEGTSRSGLLGTPAYMSPEQFDGGRSDAASDQFAYCVALFEALAGRRPFPGDDLPTLRAAVLAGRRRARPRGGAPAALWRVIERGLAVDPLRRWPTMQSLSAAIEEAARPRSRWLAAAVALGVLVPVGVIAAPLVGVPARCRGHDRLEAAWSPARARALHAALADAPVAYAGTTAARVVETFDAYAQAWIDAHDEVCRGPAPSDAALGCLDDRVAALDELAGLIETASPTVTSSAAAAAERLEPPRGCTARVPTSGAATSEARAISREVSSARAAMLLTGTELEIGEAEALRDRADATADPRLAAEARALLGTVIARAARWDEAMPVLEDAYLRAYELGDDALATDTACNLALGATWRGDHEDALRWSNLALAIAPTPERRAAIGSTASQALLAMGRTADAEAALAEALSDGAPPDVRASALTTLGTMRTQAGQLDLAEPALVEAIALVEQHAGPGHPDAIAAINVLGIVQIQRGRLRDAVLTLERAHAAAVADYGELHPFVGFVLGNLGMVYRQLGDYDRGYRTLLAALAIFERTDAPDDARVMISLQNLAVAALEVHRPEDALRHASIALDRGGEYQGDGGANLWTLVARARRELGDPEGSLVAWDRALTLSRGRLSEDTLGWTELEAAITALRLGDAGRRRAEAHIAAALEHYARSDGTSPRERARAELAAARVFADAKDRAIDHLRRAAALVETSQVPAADRMLELVATWVALGGEAWAPWSAITEA